MANVGEMRIFDADQIKVHSDLPAILKAYSKEVIRNSPQNIITFSRQYFEDQMKKHGFNIANIDDYVPPQDFNHGEEIKIENVYKMIHDDDSEWGLLRKTTKALHKKSGHERNIT